MSGKYLDDQSSWDELFDDPDLVTYLYNKDFDSPSKIQSSVLRKIKDTEYSLIASSPNGSGKTLSFVLATLLKIDRQNQNLQAIILSPNAEISKQTRTVYLDPISEEFKLTLCHLYPPNKNLSPCQILNCSPSIFSKIKIDNETGLLNYDISNVKIIVIDEADEFVINSALKKQLSSFLDLIKPYKIQFLIFSATLSKYSEAKGFYTEYFPNHMLLTSEYSEVLQRNTKHYVINTPSINDRYEIVVKLFELLNESVSFVFVNQKTNIEYLEHLLNEKKYKFGIYYSKYSQEQRQQLFEKFIKREIRVIICTDNLSRGVDVPSANVVINIELPSDSTVYVQRQGRCGRFGKDGLVMSFTSSETFKQDKDLIDEIRIKYSTELVEIPTEEIPKIIRK